MFNEIFGNQTELGDLFDLTSHGFGKALSSIGLRTPSNEPSMLAFDGNYVAQKYLPHGGYHYVWHRERTIKAMLDAGFELRTGTSCKC